MRVFLTGVSGYVGGVIARRLGELSDVELISGMDVASPPGDIPRLVFVGLDMRSAQLRDAMRGHDIVVHSAFVAAWKHAMPASERDDINLRGVRNVAEAARDVGVSHFVHISSHAAYDLVHPGRLPFTEDAPLGQGDSPSYYANGKAAAERTVHQVLDATETELTILRPTGVIGPADRLWVAAFRAAPFNFGRTDPHVQFVHEDDLADAVVLVLRKRLTGVYNVVPDDALRKSEVLRLLGVQHVRALPLPLVELIGWFQWRWRGSPFHPSSAWLGTRDYIADNARLRAAGWTPRYTSATAIQSALVTT